MVDVHPYETAPERAFWSRSVTGGLRAADFVGQTPFIRRGEAVASAGSCFAANLVPYLESAGFHYLRTEPRHPSFAHVKSEGFRYDSFSAAYGNVYTARQLLQLLQRCLGLFTPAEDRWKTPDGIVDAFRPGLRHRAGSDREFNLLTAQHLRRTLEAFRRAHVFVFTLGLTEAWVSRLDGAVFPACPGTVAGAFDHDRHAFRNYTVADTVADLDAFFRLARTVNPELRLIVSVSPVPLVATATGQHVLTATTYSKAVLRAAAAEVSALHDAVAYFPAYEIVTGPQAPHTFFEPDRRSVSKAGVAAVMEIFFACCEGDTTAPTAALEAGVSAAALSGAISEAECEEAMAANRSSHIPDEPAG